jgi:hypothetical protein
VTHLRKAVVAGLLAALSSQVFAKVAADKAAELDGPRLTCLGAERSASKAGVAAYTGRYLGTWPGVKKPYGYEPGPYASEARLFTITAQNQAQYADKLTEGQKALLQKYPQSYAIPVYPSHRDFRLPDSVCERTKLNAVNSEILHEGKGITGIAGGVPFPIPQSGLELVWNMTMAYRAWSETVTADSVAMYANGASTWGRSRFIDMSPEGGSDKRVTFQDKIAAWFYISYQLPERDRGNVAVGFTPFDFSEQTLQSWQYMPGTRRVRQAPEVGYDYPVPPAGLHTSDEDGLFNGSPERYNWKIVGKKELYVPYHNFRINDPAIKYSDLIKPNTINPEYERYELHRVWVLKADLKPGLRHIYSKRLLYVDEDTWLALWADNYDARGSFWRTSFVNHFYSQESSAFHRGVTVYHDLTSGSYEATYLVNERSDGWWRLNQKYPLSMFTPEAAARSGH